MSLKTLVSILNDDEIIKELLSRFRCAYDESQVENFLHNDAIKYDRNGWCRTYIFTNNDFSVVFGFFSVGIQNLKFAKSISNETKYELTSKKVHNSASPCFVLAQIGKCDGCNLPKGILLETAVNTVKNIHDGIGGCFICLDCKPELCNYYSRVGFNKLHENDYDVQMVLKLTN